MDAIKEVSRQVLVVDDEAGARSALTELLREEGYEVHAAADGFKALGRIDDWVPDVVITDLKMPGMSGIELMDKVRDQVPEAGVIVMTAFGSVESAVEAMQQGADDYLTKPLHLDHLLVVLERVLEHRALRRQAEQMRTVLEQRKTPEGQGIIGNSKPFRELVALAEQVADSDASVLISGEGGTGKQLIAQAMHEWGERRKEKPFVVVKCGALSPDVMEAELFGRVAGDTAHAAAGRVAQAEGGTLFLDEIDAAPAAVQVRLLQLLQDGSYEQVGSQERRKADVRIIAATEKDLRALVDAEKFREDLYYRINVISLRVPTLRERIEDVPRLANYFLEKFASESRKTILGFHERALGVLLHFDWPGNVRQLEHCIERAVALCTGQEIEPRHLPRELMSNMRQSDEMPPVPGATLRELERFAILRTLEHVGGSTSKAARMLGISPRKIQYRLNEYREEGTVPPRKAS